MIAKQDGLGDYIHFVAMFPVDPDVFERNPAAEAVLVQRPQSASEINGVFFEAALQAALARTPRVKMAGPGDEGLNASIRNSNAGEVRIIERETELRHSSRNLGST